MSQLLGPRLLGVLAGALTAGLLALFFARRDQPLAAWTAGLLAAVSAGLTVHARFATVDVLATAFLVAGLLAACRAPSRRGILVAATLFGLAAACKYNTALGLLALAAPIAGRPKADRLLDGAFALAAFFAVFLAGVPGIVLEPQAFRRDFVFELIHSAQGHDTVFAGTSPGFLYQVGNLGLAFGFGATALGAVGLGLAARRGERWAWALLLFAVPYYLLIGRAEVKFLRYCLPLVPVLALGCGALLERLREDPRRARGAVALAIALVGGLDGGGLVRSLPFALDMVRPDARDAAGASLKGQGVTVGLARDPWFWTPTLYPETSAPRSVGPRRYFGWMLAASAPRVLRYLPPEGAAARLDFDARLLDARPDVVTLTTLETAGASRLASQGSTDSLAARYRAFMARLGREYAVERVYGDGGTPLVEDMEYVRPTVTVWKRKSP